MQITGLHELASPFIGHGILVLNGRPTDNIRGRTIDVIVEQLNSLGCGVVASLTDRKLVLTSESDFTIDGNQDVLDVIGVERC